MNFSDDLKELLDHVTKLKALLEDPHPGLLTWRIAFKWHIDYILNWKE